MSTTGPAVMPFQTAACLIVHLRDPVSVTQPHPSLLAARKLSIEEQQQMRDAIRSSPELSMAMDFLETFEAVLKLTTEFTINSLEEELINSNGTEPGALRDLHMVLHFLTTFIIKPTTADPA